MSRRPDYDRELIASFDDCEIIENEIENAIDEYKSAYKRIKKGEEIDFSDIPYSETIKDIFDVENLNEFFKNMTNREFSNFLEEIEHNNKLWDYISSDSFIFEMASEDLINDLEYWYENITKFKKNDYSFAVEKHGELDLINANDMKDLFFKISPNNYNSVHIYQDKESKDTLIFRFDSSSYIVTLAINKAIEWLQNVSIDDFETFLENYKQDIEAYVSEFEYDEDSNGRILYFYDKELIFTEQLKEKFLANPKDIGECIVQETDVLF